MKALKIKGAEDMAVDDVQVPEPNEGEVRVRMQYGGICGSDLHYYFHGRNGEYEVREPFTPGHEMSGVVDLDPSGTLAAGTPVTIAPATFGESQPGIEDRKYLWPGGTYLGSASTQPHTQGGMQEYRVVKDFMVRVLPEGLDVKDAALAEPLAVALHALSIGGGVSGKRVLVTGCGPIGLCVIAAAVAKGAVQVDASDVLAGPLARAKSVGAATTYTSGSDEIEPMTYDIAFECSGVAPAVTQALAAVRRAGTVCQVGMLPNEASGVNLAPFVSKEVTYLGCFRFDDEIDDAIQLLVEHPEIAGVVTHVLPAERAEEAFAIARDSEQSGKVLVSLWLD
ncbi:MULTISPECIES: L-idonate 5-dehydrogenase [unclassified Luteococcus]|uniref:L-idonate 5-dehydrogenase n=1 Tax=unclassified Luteococcus TaxID=2639923 RepID=UPI00313B9801